MPALDIDEDAATLTREAAEVVEQIRALLGGRNMVVQAAVTTEMLALFVVGWPRQVRAEILEHLLDEMRRTLPAMEFDMFGPEGHPSNDGRD